jgi:hypothetical protein
MMAGWNGSDRSNKRINLKIKWKLAAGENLLGQPS